MKNSIGFVIGILFGLIIMHCLTVLTITKSGKEIIINVSNVSQENTNFEYKRLLELNEILKKNYIKYGKYYWADSLGSINNYLSHPECWCHWDTYVVDSNQYELLVVKHLTRPYNKYYLLTNDSLYDINLIPLTIRLDTIEYKKTNDNSWLRAR